jgi:CRISP-associated protein Cas1
MGGHTVGTGHRNVETRTHQYRTSFDPQTCLRLARGWVHAKIANCRTMLRRNWRGSAQWDKGDDSLESDAVAGTAIEGSEIPRELMLGLREGMERARSARSIESLLGIEGAAANRYFQNFASLLRAQDNDSLQFDFMKRNRRPPRDPVNALLSFAYAMLTREGTIALSQWGWIPISASITSRGSDDRRSRST